MNKKDFYEAPEWGLRTVRVERQYLLEDSPGSGYNYNGGAGNDMTENDDYTYTF